jgi:hypothetical protein
MNSRKPFSPTIASTPIILVRESDGHNFWIQCGTLAGRRRGCTMVDLPLEWMSLVALSGGVSTGPGAFAVPSLVIGDIGVEQLVPSHSNLYFNCACVLHRCTH